MFEFIKLVGVELHIHIQGRDTKIPLGGLFVVLGFAFILFATVLPQAYTQLLVVIGVLLFIIAVVIFGYKPGMLKR